MFNKEKHIKNWELFLKESDSVKEKRAEAIEISSDRKQQKTEHFEFEFLQYQYKVDKAEYPRHPSAEFQNECLLTIRTNKGSLETKFVYKYIIKDYLNNILEGTPFIEIKDLESFEAFINDEQIKLDKGTAKKISSNYKLDQKEIKKEFLNQFDRIKYTNFLKVKDELFEINRINIELVKFQDMMNKSDEISKIIKKFKTPIQKIVFYRDVLVLFDGYLNEKMRISTKKALDSFETELWSINDQKLRKKAEDINSEVLKELSKIGSGKLVYISRKEEISQDF